MLIAACATMGGIAMTITVASIALAGVQGELRLGIAQLQWVLNSFIVSYALLLLPFGAWSDRRGQRPLFLWGAVVFVVGAAGAVLARDVAVLIAGRAIQGVGAALLTATAPAALTLAFQNEADRKRAFGYMATRRRSHRVSVPMRALLKNRSFVLSCVVCVLFTTVWVALFIYGPLHMQAIDGLDPRTVGTSMLSLLLPALWALWVLLALTAAGAWVSLQIRDAKSLRR